MISFDQEIELHEEEPVNRGQSGFADLFSYERLSVSTNEKEALRLYREAAASQKGVPVLVADDSDCILLDAAAFAFENGEASPKSIQAMLLEAQSHSAGRYFAETFKRLPLQWRQVHRGKECELLGNDGLCSGFDPCRFELLRLPTDHPWEIPAYLPFFHPYDGPSLEQLISVLKDWHARYGAQILCVSFDMLQFLFDRSRMDESAYHRLAREIFCIHPALVIDYYQNFDNLLYNLQNSEEPIFQLWWD